jgi:hypothetical protein
MSHWSEMLMEGFSWIFVQTAHDKNLRAPSAKGKPAGENPAIEVRPRKLAYLRLTANHDESNPASLKRPAAGFSDQAS